MTYHGAERMPGQSHEDAQRMEASGLYGLVGEDLDDFLADTKIPVQGTAESENESKRQLSEEPLIL